MLRAIMMKHQIKLSGLYKVKSKLLSLYFLDMRGREQQSFLNKTAHDVLRCNKGEASLIH